MQGLVRRLVVIGAAATAVVAMPVAASAESAGGEFGQHVSACAQTMGFDGAHNPGMHEGFAGWEPHDC